MRCASCGSENPEGTKFCGECGAPSHPRCPQCGFANLPATKFCRDCGTPLTGQPSVPRPSTPPPRPEPPRHYTPKHLAERILAEQAALEARGLTDGERKTVTALFADLKGSTALIEELDPEEARAIIDPALQLMTDAVHRYEGYVAQALGDGIFAFFGAPIAHEDHPQRALYAALRMQEEMQRYGDQVRLKHGVPLAMRVGINSGEVVVHSIRKDDLHTDYVSVGHSTNLAARMEQMATPGSILVTSYTHKLAEGYFEFKTLDEALTIADKTGERVGEVELYRLKGELTLQSQVEGHKPKVEEAEEYFLKAIEIARKQHAKSLELRAVTSMSRLWQQQGKRAEAHQMLAEVYNWFTEGFDTKDLQEARALLDALV